MMRTSCPEIDQRTPGIGALKNWAIVVFNAQLDFFGHIYFFNIREIFLCPRAECFEVGVRRAQEARATGNLAECLEPRTGSALDEAIAGNRVDLDGRRKLC
jgi:hypothetical protein